MLGSVLGTAAIVVGTVALLEGGASLLLFARDARGAGGGPTYLRPYLTRDTLLGWTSKPGFASPAEYGPGIGLTITPEGFRAATPASTAVPAANGAPVGGATSTLVCSGDAATLGMGVDDAHHWCARLADHLPGARPVNLGQLAFGVDQSYLRYRRDGARLAARTHVFAVTQTALERALGGEHAGRVKPYLDVEGGRLVTRNVPVPVQTSEPLRRAARARLRDELRIVQLARRLPMLDARRALRDDLDARWPVLERMLDELAREDSARGTRLVLAVLPSRRELQPGDADALRERIVAFGARRGVPVVDLAPPLRTMRRDSADLAFIARAPKGAAPGLLGNYSKLGHAWIARSLAERIAALPAPSPPRLIAATPAR